MIRVRDLVERLQDLRDEARHVARAVRRERYRGALVAEARVLVEAGPKLLPWVVRSRESSRWTLLRAALAHAKARPDAVAVVMDDRRVTWAELAERTSRVAHALSACGVREGDTFALLAPNSPDYLTIVLAATRVGAVAALVNTHLEGAPLAHAMRVSGARVAVVHARYERALREAARDLVTERLSVVVLGRDAPLEGDLEALAARAPSRPFAPAEVHASSDFVHIYTSGTTGLPKPSRVAHARALIAGAGFAKAVWRFDEADVLYTPLPLYHSSALLLGAGACIVTGATMALRESFSARAFWPDVRRYGATAILYIGELARYLLELPPSPSDRDHRVRVAVGNGMRGDVWTRFAERFGVREIREFYGATEAPGAMLNLVGEPGAMGRMPFRELLPFKVARYDIDKDEHVRDARGFCVECAPGEVGELLIRLSEGWAFRSMLEYRGYTDARATSAKVMTDVFREGDRYYRSGDLVRFDDDDFFYFVDRIGDTFRYKGENVSTTEVAAVVGRAPGVRGAAVVGVVVPGVEGQAGLAVVAADGDLDWGAFARTVSELPSYARPRFVRVAREIGTTGTLKITKAKWRAEGIDPAKIADPIRVLQGSEYVPFTRDLARELAEQRLRL